MLNRCLYKFTAIFIALSPIGFTQASVIDLYQSFPNNQGDNGFYAYGYAPSINTYQALTATGNNSFYRPGDQWGNPQLWGGSNSWLGSPWVGLITSGTQSATGIPEDAVLAYVIPTTAKYEFNGSFYVYPQSLYGTNVYIKDNNTTLWSSYLAPGTELSFNVPQLEINAGDTIYFGAGSLNQYSFSEYNNWPFLQGKIISSPVPLPASISLFGLAFASFLGFSRRKVK